MKLFYYFFYFLFSYISLSFAYEYVYPIASLHNGEIILYIHQESPTNLKLFTWDTASNHKEQMLWSLFNPAGLLLLPDNSGFSFIDNGRLRIQHFQKRSPKTIDFDEPLFNINGLVWINEHMCYCSAQQSNNFALFQLSDDGLMQCLLAEDGKDCMYPQKINDCLFYIERSIIHDFPKTMHYKIMNYNEIIFDFDGIPIIFLTMISSKEGFVIEHPQTIDTNDQAILFTYYHIIKQDNTWHKNYLFHFHIPTNLLLKSEQQLYESLLPLLPRLIKDKIYFVDCSYNNDFFLEPYFYDLLTKTMKKIILPKKQGHYFVPLLCGERFYCGGTTFSQKEPFFYFLT